MPTIGLFLFIMAVNQSLVKFLWSKKIGLAIRNGCTAALPTLQKPPLLKGIHKIADFRVDCGGSLRGVDLRDIKSWLELCGMIH